MPVLNPDPYGHLNNPDRMTIASASPQPQQQGQPDPPSYTEQAYGQVLDVHQRHRDYLAQADADLSSEQRARYAAAFDGGSQLDVLAEAFDRQLSAYQADYETAVAAQSANIDEQAALRVRDRLLRRLEHADKKQVAAQEILKTCPDSELGVALQEVPSYLEVNGLATDFIEQVLAERCPEIADKAARLRKAQQTSAIGRETIRKVREGVRTATPPHVLMKAEDLAKYDPAR
jgi:hypothetical protein